MTEIHPTTAPRSFKLIGCLPGYRFGDDGSIESRWVRGSKRGRMADAWHPVKARRNVRRDYLYVTLKTPEGRRHLRVNILILWAFTGHRPPGMEAAHKNGDRTDNRAENLEWKTHAANIADKAAHGTVIRGQAIPSSRLTPAEVVLIRRRRAAGESFAAIGRVYGVSESTIRAIINGRNWKGVV